MIIEKYKKIIVDKVCKIYDVGYEEIYDSMTKPPKSELGDIALPMFGLAKKLGQSPMVISENIKSKFDLPQFNKIEFVGGYLNFSIDRGEYISDILNHDLSFEHNKLKTVVEYMSANPNKPLHIGQARNICIGDTMARIYEFMGYNVHRLNYGDDSGVNVGYNILAHMFYNYPLDTDRKFDHYCGEIYSQMMKRAEEPEIKERLSQILLKIEKASDPEVNKLHHDYTRKCTLAQFESCWRINAFFDLVNWETDILHLDFFGQAMSKLQKDGFIRLETEGEAKGCWIIDLSSLPEFVNEEKKYQVLVKSDGVATYVGKDIAYAMWKLGKLNKDFFYNKFAEQPNGKNLITTNSSASDDKYDFGNYDMAISVIDNRQSFAQKVVGGSLKLLGYNQDDIYRHLSYGIVNVSPKTLVAFGYTLNDEEMAKAYLPFSSRKGWYITIDETMDTLVNKIKQETKSKNPDKDQSWLDAVSEDIALGAFRFSLIRSDITKDMIFDIDDALAFDGESGVYVLYTYARISSILAKGQSDKSKLDIKNLKDDLEFDILKKIDELDVVLHKTLDMLQPSFLVKYIYELCQMFNTYYNKNKIIGSDAENERLVLLGKLQRTMKTAMNLLGMKEIDRM